MNNQNLKLYAASKGVRLWQVAEKFGVSDAAFSRKLRKEFSREDAERFKKYVDEIASDGLKKVNDCKWIETNVNDMTFMCPKCGHEYKHGVRFNYCPNCGAMMERGE